MPTEALPGILIIDHDENLLASYRVLLEDEYKVYTAASGNKGLNILQQENVNVVLLDIRLPDIDGMQVLRETKAADKSIDVIIMTAIKNVRMAVDAIKLGAADYLVKPLEIDEVLSLLHQTLEHQNLKREVLYLRSEAGDPQDLNKIVGSSQKMHQVYDLICRVADTNSTVLIHGESGTGKELIARAIHQNSQRRVKPFVAVNCAAISEHLIESEFFGHERGAFTGALEKRLGKFELANSGVLLLDEIASLRLDLQSKLLRVLQEHEFERVGGTKTIQADVRIVAVTNQDLKQRVAEGAFREDLFYRLNVVPIQIPPLRERREDVPLLVDFFLARYNKAFQRQVRFTPAALSAMGDYNWPGNVRELENVVERLVTIIPHDELTVEDLPRELVSGRHNVVHAIVFQGGNLRQARAEFERHYILRTLEMSDWNQAKAAKILGIHRNTLAWKMATLQLRLPSRPGPSNVENAL